MRIIPPVIAIEWLISGSTSPDSLHLFTMKWRRFYLQGSLGAPLSFLGGMVPVGNIGRISPDSHTVVTLAFVGSVRLVHVDVKWWNYWYYFRSFFFFLFFCRQSASRTAAKRRNSWPDTYPVRRRNWTRWATGRAPRPARYRERISWPWNAAKTSANWRTVQPEWWPKPNSFPTTPESY